MIQGETNMTYADHYCSYTEDCSPKHTYTFTGLCINTGDSVSVTVDGKDLFEYRNGKCIQDAFSYLTPQEREFLMSGYMFSDNEVIKPEEEDYCEVCADDESIEHTCTNAEWLDEVDNNHNKRGI